MRFELLSLALAATARAQSSNVCKDDIEINELNYNFGCDVVEGKVTVSESLDGALQLSSVKQFKSDFTITNATKLLSIQSTSLNSIGGTFTVSDCNFLTNIQLSSLKTVNELSLERNKILTDLTFGNSSEIKSVQVLGCDNLADLSNLKLNSVENMKIINNPALKKFNSSIVSINETLIITGNADNKMDVALPDLESAKDVQLSGIKSFSVPSLETIGSALRAENNTALESFEAESLTLVGENEKTGGSLSFNNNNKLVNMSFPVLEKINGDLTVLNNTNLTVLTGFPELTSVYGALLLGGAFEEIDLPKIKDLDGAVTVKSSTGSDKVCSFLDNAKVAGKKSCVKDTSEEEANSKDGKGGSSGGSSGEDDKDSGAASFQLGTAVMGLAIVAGVAQLL